jgi:hypothetical protein
MATYLERIQQIEKMMQEEADPTKREIYKAIITSAVEKLERTSPIIHSMQTEAKI